MSLVKKNDSSQKVYQEDNISKKTSDQVSSYGVFLMFVESNSCLTSCRIASSWYFRSSARAVRFGRMLNRKFFISLSNNLNVEWLNLIFIKKNAKQHDRMSRAYAPRPFNPKEESFLRSAPVKKKSLGTPLVRIEQQNNRPYDYANKILVSVVRVVAHKEVSESRSQAAIFKISKRERLKQIYVMRGRY